MHYLVYNMFGELKYGRKYAAAQRKKTQAQAKKRKQRMEKVAVEHTLESLRKRMNDVVNLHHDELRFYLDRFVEHQDPNVDDILKELFVLLKLQYSDQCPDYVGMENRARTAAKLREQEKEQKRLERIERLKTARPDFIEEKMAWILKHIEIYQFISENNNKYTHEDLYNIFDQQHILHLQSCNYIKHSWWGLNPKLSITNVYANSPPRTSPEFCRLNWRDSQQDSIATKNFREYSMNLKLKEINENILFGQQLNLPENTKNDELCMLVKCEIQEKIQHIVKEKGLI